ncbi:uncharacterized protein E0L32_000784 [Thyridium curvatum]|uniref:Uncharacterized protein n=1 Tax=Thyridium curvatum TaxID=1093900 RepID=A0A507AYK9_9PEZI|nr:uncharacterized protein E0L32_000784 [Thyridium curvatum]TPX12607.1 hypothetical protein E0L32_000784 [Thyridium curvatum]
MRISSSPSLRHAALCALLLARTVDSAALSQAARTVRVWSTVQSTVTAIPFINPRRMTVYTTQTVTSLQDAPRPTVFPTTVVETAIMSITWESRVTYLDDGATTTEFSSTTATVPSTWVVAGAPQPTNLAVGRDPACGKSPIAAAAEAPQCASRGLHTGCQGQCQLRDGAFWCLLMGYADYKVDSLKMGRACWGGDNQFEQLNTPCLEGDQRTACTADKGLDDSWGAVNWIGPIAGH